MSRGFFRIRGNVNTNVAFFRFRNGGCCGHLTSWNAGCKCLMFAEVDWPRVQAAFWYFQSEPPPYEATRTLLQTRPCAPAGLSSHFCAFTYLDMEMLRIYMVIVTTISSMHRVHLATVFRFCQIQIIVFLYLIYLTNSFPPSSSISSTLLLYQHLTQQNSQNRNTL